MRTSSSIITTVQSGSAAVRLREARRFLEQFEARRGGAAPWRIARFGRRSRARDFAGKRRDVRTPSALFHPARGPAGRHGTGFSASVLPRRRWDTKQLRRAQRSRPAAMTRLKYFSPVSQTPGFPKALARTLLDLRLAAVASGDLARLPRSGTDLAALLDRVDTLLNEAGASDRASLFETATKALGSPVTGWPTDAAAAARCPFRFRNRSAVSLGASPAVAAGADYGAGRRRLCRQPAGEARRAPPDHRGNRARTI